MTELEQKMEALIILLSQRLRSKLFNDERATPGDRTALLESDCLLAEIYKKRFPES